MQGCCGLPVDNRSYHPIIAFGVGVVGCCRVLSGVDRPPAHWVLLPLAKSSAVASFIQGNCTSRPVKFTMRSSTALLAAFWLIAPRPLLVGSYDSASGETCMENEGEECTATHGESDFYAWLPKEDTLIGSLFPDLKMLQDAWEQHPLLSKVNSESMGDMVEDKDTSKDTITTCLHNRRSKFEGGMRALDPVLSMEVDDVLRILSQPNLRHHRDYKLAKRIVREGEEHLGMLPNPGYSLEEIIRHFNLGKSQCGCLRRLQLSWLT